MYYRRLAFLLAAPVAARGAPVTPLVISPHVEQCQATVTTHRYQRGDAGFDNAAAYVNRFFSTRVELKGSVRVAAERRPVVPGNTEVLKIIAKSVSCVNGRKASSGNAAAQGCTYVGCVEDLPPQFDSLPSGSTVSISTCGGGVQTNSNYARNGQGLWVMTGYRTEMVDSCSPQL
jgi:hypothetical protein